VENASNVSRRQSGKKWNFIDFFQTLPVRYGCLVERQVSKFEQVRPKLFLEAFEFVRLQSDPTTRPAWRRLIAEAAAEGRVLSPREEQHGID
jgi:hypothetical protein